MRKLLMPVLAAACIVGASAPAVAGEVTFKVSYADLDLSKPADVDQMKERIALAVTKACGRPAIAAFYGSRAVEDCKTDGTAKAMQELDAKRDLAFASTATDKS